MIKEQAVTVLQTEAKSILDLVEKIDSSFEKMIELICASSGRVVISGIGKSGLIAKKIVATLTSTGTNSLFLHPVEAIHGDLGIVSKKDVFIAISNSGETEEISQLIPAIRGIGCGIIAFTGNADSTLAHMCDIVINTGVEKEACPLGLAPTSSTTAQLAMGDALAVVLINKKQIRASDFKRSHPGGALGQRLSCRVGEIMFAGSRLPCVPQNTLMQTAISVMEEHKLGAVLILGEERTLKGIITDGDIRHFVAEGMTDFAEIAADSVMTTTPRTVSADSYLYDALNIMETYQITVLPVVEKNNRLEGILHLHDILGKGAFKFNGGPR